MSTGKHIWNFSTVGGIKRVNIESGKDLEHLSELDQKLWTALSCPVQGLEIDSKTLELIDSDKDGKIRVPEIISAVNWMLSILKNPDDLLLGSQVFPLSAINQSTAEGKLLYSSAKIVLSSLGKSDKAELSVEETSDIKTIFSTSRFNGDGVIPETAISDEELLTVFKDILTCIPGIEDRGGRLGISEEIINKFVEHCTAYSNWQAQINLNDKILFLNENTESAYQSFIAVKNKIDDYFIRCRFASFDNEVTQALNLNIAKVELISEKDLSESLSSLAEYPIVKIVADKNLPLEKGINPAWELAMKNFKKNVIDIMYPGTTELSEELWGTINASFSEYKDWANQKLGQEVEALGILRVNEILNNGSISKLNELILLDKEMEEEVNKVYQVDQMVRYYRDLFRLINNFVTFYDFYSPGDVAIFQAGTLYIDQRSCDLCIKVNDFEKHQTMVSISGMFLIYCECTSKKSGERMKIVAGLTNGDIDNLVVGRNALFYDREGGDWDATVIKIVDNPISIRQAFWSPYRKVSRFIESQINKFAASQDEKVVSQANKSVEDTHVKVVEAAPPPKAAPPPFDIGKFVGIFAAISLALGAIGTAIASIIAGFVKLLWWQMPLAIMGIMLLISGPAMIMAFLKLRKRNLAPILDANGWAINANVIVNIPFGNTLTHIATLPKGAKVNLHDPFMQKKRPFLPYIIAVSIITGIVFYLLWKYGYMHIPLLNK